MERSEGVLLRELAGAFPGGVAIQRGETFAYVSEPFASMVGVDGEALEGSDWRSLFPPGEVATLEAGMEAARDEGNWTGEVRTGGPEVYDRRLQMTLAAVAEGPTVWLVPDRELTGDPTRQGSFRDLVEAAPVPIWIQREERLVYLNDAAASFFGAEEPAAVVGRSDLEFVVDEERERSLRRNRRIIENGEVMPVMEGRKEGLDGKVRHGLFAGASIQFRGEDAILVIARDITGRKERERELQRQRDELATLDRIAELLLETTRELVQSSSRDGVEQTVCERLADSALYKFAWVGERELDGDKVRPRTRAGDGAGYLEKVTIETDTAAADPVVTALETGQVTACNVADLTDEDRRAAARESGFRTVAAVPLHHRGTVYGVLVVYATREDAFTEREQAGFDVVGRTVGSVIYAARSRTLLFADAVVELEFEVPGRLFLPDGAAVDAELTLDGYVAADPGWIVFLGGDADAQEAVVREASGEPSVERARALGEGGVELVLRECPVLDLAAAAGASVSDARMTGSTSRVTVDVPADATVRAVVDQFLADFPEASLLARRERDREVATGGQPPGPLAALTDRQREVLEIAYRAGYFEWPRESDAEAVATSVGISRPTLQGHLRKAQAEILRVLLDED